MLCSWGTCVRRERVSWDTIPGLTGEQRYVGSCAWPGLNLGEVVMRDTEVDGVRIPDIVHGMVVLHPSGKPTPEMRRRVQWIPAPLVCECVSCVAARESGAAASADCGAPE